MSRPLSALGRLGRGDHRGDANLLPAARQHQDHLKRTNMLERLNEEIRRRERVIRIFANRASAGRLLGAVLMEHDEAWSTGKLYPDMTQYWQWREAR